jgi:positive phototaxis protein PixI
MLMSSESALTTVDSLDPLYLDPLPPDNRQRVLRFRLGSQNNALLPLAQITEILRVDVTDILPVPELSPCILGLGNWRGNMLWLIDLNHLVGNPPLFQPESELTPLIVIVVEVNQQLFGLGVQAVHDVERYDLDQLQPVVPGLFPGQYQPFVLGTLPGVEGAVLNITAIAACPLWHRPAWVAPQAAP